jgi:CRISPR-associated protein Cas1
MSTLCIVSQGAKINRESKRLVILYPDNTKREVPLLNLERIMIFGNTTISTSTLGFISDAGIEVSLFTSHGKYRGKLHRGCSRNVFLREAQYSRGSNYAFILKTAKIIVKGKLKNQHAQLLRFKRNHPYIQLNGIKSIEVLLDEAGNKKDLDEVRGIEGMGSRIYFGDFKLMLLTATDFKKRVRRPPGDKVNALLSLGYTFLTNEMTGIIEFSGFDPYYGFLHRPVYGRPSLSLDLIEEFRTPVVERLVLEGLNKSIFTEDDFEYSKDEKGNRKVFLKEDGLKKFLKLWERKVGKIGRSNYMDLIQYRKEFRNQVIQFEKYILEEQPYVPFNIK